MELQRSLREVVAQFFDTDPNQIGPDFPLTGKRMQGSLARARLDAAIRRTTGVRTPAVYSARSYAELEAAVAGHSVEPSLSVPAADPLIKSTVKQVDVSASQPVSCGVDVEMVNNLPKVEDFWEDEFYKSSFTPVEIAYCLMQENPLIHFAARWCAKEALRKCDIDYLEVKMSEIELVAAKSSSPYLGHYVQGQIIRLPFAVSVSHTPSVAVAIVIKLVANASQSAPTVQEPNASDPLLLLPGSTSSPSSWVATVFAILAVGLASWALLRTFLVF
jgi:phosphopantetheinyl transferase (holo-ACP synthase)